ncbi:amino acid transporter AVT1C [Orussus abietinus]|uniref:amino acid transporter AVT1C n=1 Tax=Orussus abietinus TaxID=222816 RepID=UPI000C716088|nr:amino acid transporter AVT1C [Orussus abietinus]
MHRESIPLLHGNSNSGLTVFFATLCIIDIFGVFPVIALPRAIVQCGLFVYLFYVLGLLGIPLVFIVFGLQMYTAALLGKSWIIATALDPHIFRKNRYPLAAVTELTLGSWARTCVTILLDFTVFGGGIPNLLVASQNLQLFGQEVSGKKFDLSFCYWLLVVGVLLCPFMWLGSPRDMKWLALCSSLIVGFTAILIWWSIASLPDSSKPIIPVPNSPTWDKFISGYGMLAFQFDVHPTLMTIQVDMRNPGSIDKAVVLAFLVSGSLFGVTSALAIWKFGGGMTANVLQLAPDGVGIRAAVLLAALQLCLSSAVGHSALFQHLEDRLDVQRSFGWKRCVIRCMVVFLGVVLGESVPRFDIVMALIGGSLIGPLVFVLPPLMYARARALKKSTRGRVRTPEIFSSTERRPGSVLLDSLSDPRVHSRSTYLGFVDATNNPNSPNNPRYSYLYYRNGDDNGDDQRLDVATNPRSSTDEEDERIVFVDASREGPRSDLNRHRPSTSQRAWTSSMADWFGYCIVVLGIVITISSTYINVRNTIRFVRFTPPCIVNVTTVYDIA